jgi:cytochrome c oxidase cbb3-type subunit 1
MHPYYIARTVGGLLFLLGAIVGTYNVLMTIAAARREHAQEKGETDEPAFVRDPITQPGE